HRELGEDLEQCTWMVVGDERNHRGAIGPGRGRRRLAGRGDDNKAGDRTGDVVDVVGKDIEAVAVGSKRRGDGGIRLVRCHGAGAVGRARRWDEPSLWDLPT